MKNHKDETAEEADLRELVDISVKNAFGYYSSSTKVKANDKKGERPLMAIAEVRAEETLFSFEKLSSLAADLGTNLINIGSEERDDGYCETCSAPYNVVVLTIRWKV